MYVYLYTMHTEQYTASQKDLLSTCAIIVKYYYLHILHTQLLSKISITIKTIKYTT